MRKETEEQLNQILGALIVPESTKNRLVNFVKGLEAEIEANLHQISHLEREVEYRQSDYEDISNELEELRAEMDEVA